MKIIAIDNYDRESVSDLLVCEHLNSYYSKLIFKFLTSLEPHCDYVYRLVSDDYVLYEFEP